MGSLSSLLASTLVSSVALDKALALSEPPFAHGNVEMRMFIAYHEDWIGRMREKC